MTQRKNKFLFLSELEIYKHRLKQQDIKNCTYDTLRKGYWIKSNSLTHVLLILKNVTLITYKYDIRF